jgi:hypothetical protein
MYWNAIFQPILHQDATVYHAVTPNILFLYHRIPFLGGPSIGIEISLNYPPLNYAFIAFYYLLAKEIQVLFLKAVSPSMGMMTALVVYKIGKLLSGEMCGKISALLLSTTSLFVLYSINETSYMTLTFFVSASILFMLIGFSKDKKEYWLLSGLFFSFALLSDYDSLVIAPLFVLPLIFMMRQTRTNQNRSLNSANLIAPLKKYIALIIFPLTLLGSIWYARNLILLGNPFYPFLYTLFGGKFLVPWMFNIVNTSIQQIATLSYFGNSDPTLLQKVYTFFFDFQHFPSFSLVAIFGILLMLKEKRNMQFLTLIGWALLPIFFTASGFQWIFPRYFVVILPPFAIFSAYVISKTLNARDTSKYMSRFARIFVAIVLIALVFFPGLTISLIGQGTTDAPNARPNSGSLYLFEHPGITPLNLSYYQGMAPSTWKFLNENLKPGQKVATFENKVYYIKNGDPAYFFYLDGYEARSLYNITDPNAMVSFLKESNVSYIYDTDWEPNPLSGFLPLENYLDSPWFPKVFDPSPCGCLLSDDGFAGGVIYNVGPIQNPITNNTTVSVSLNEPGWYGPNIVNGRETMAAIGANVNNLLANAPRIYVQSLDPTLLTITYLDRGYQKVDFHLYNQPANQSVIYGYATAFTSNTNTWKTLSFILPGSLLGYVMLGVHVYSPYKVTNYSNDFVVSSVKAIPLSAPAKYSLDSKNTNYDKTCVALHFWSCSISYNGFVSFTNLTSPTSAMVYLPMLEKGQNLSIYVDSDNQNVSLDLFSGDIPPTQLTDWWLTGGEAREPALPVFGEVNPSLNWIVPFDGSFTLVIPLWEASTTPTQIAISIVIN